MKYPDGRLIPTEGDKVFQAVRGPFGTPAYIYGVVKRGRVVIESSASLVGGGGPKKGKTYPLNAYWTVVDDPELKRREQAREDKRKAELERQEIEKREIQRKQAESIRRALEEEGHKRVDPSTVKPGDIVMLHYRGEREIRVVESYDPSDKLSHGSGWLYTVEPGGPEGGSGYSMSSYTVPPKKNPFLEALGTGIGFGAGLFGVKTLMNKKNPIIKGRISWKSPSVRGIILDRETGGTREHTVLAPGTYNIWDKDYSIGGKKGYVLSDGFDLYWVSNTELAISDANPGKGYHLKKMKNWQDQVKEYYSEGRRDLAKMGIVAQLEHQQSALDSGAGIDEVDKVLLANPGIQCPRCSAILKSKGYGRYHCPGCRRHFRRIV